MISRQQILVAPEAQFEAHRPLFALLAEAFPLDFVGGALEAAPACHGIIAWPASAADFAVLERRGVDTLAVAPAVAPTVPVTCGRVAFGPATLLEPCFRDCHMRESNVDGFAPLIPSERDQTLCWLDAQPCWTSRPVARGQLLTVALEPPPVTVTDTLYRHFNRLGWLRLLPFLHFAKRLTREQDWSAPPLRACLMFDDPNLHWGTYGFIDYATIARHAVDCHYHAAFATIPADAWFFHPRTAQFFRDHAAQLSLLMHGNSHAQLELGREPAAGDFARLLAQALRRIERFERRSGVAVARVMAPPFGAFSAEAVNPMLHLGYEAICVSRSSLLNWNPSLPRRAAFGHGIAELLGDGFPMIPRHALGAEQDDNYRLAAFLDQPIIPHGHHRDCAGGLDALARAAKTINSFGSVRWTNLSDLSRSNFQTRRDGDTVYVRMLARRVTLPPFDSSVRKIVAVRPWINSGAGETLVCRQAGADRHSGSESHQSREIPIIASTPVELHAPPTTVLASSRLAPPSRRLWPALRRAIAESRDRAAPLVPRWLTRAA
jgi:hypothetical protein